MQIKVTIILILFKDLSLSCAKLNSIIYIELLSDDLLQ